MMFKLISILTFAFVLLSCENTVEKESEKMNGLFNKEEAEDLARILKEEELNKKDSSIIEVSIIGDTNTK